jgi:hypothetical protein
VQEENKHDDSGVGQDQWSDALEVAINKTIEVKL